MNYSDAHAMVPSAGHNRWPYFTPRRISSDVFA